MGRSMFGLSSGSSTLSVQHQRQVSTAADEAAESTSSSSDDPHRKSGRHDYIKRETGDGLASEAV